MAKLPQDAPADKVLKAFAALGFELIRKGNHLALARQNPDGTRTPMTLPGHRVIKSGTLRSALNQAGVSREEFLRVYRDA